MSDTSESSDEPLPKKRNKGGRPEGTTNAAKADIERRMAAAAQYALQLYKEEHDKNQSMRLPKGTVDECISKAKEKFNVSELVIPKSTFFIVSYKKQKGDPKLPKNKEELIQQFHLRNARPSPPCSDNEESDDEDDVEVVEGDALEDRSESEGDDESQEGDG